jgi:hypothetical protein
MDSIQTGRPRDTVRQVVDWPREKYRQAKETDRQQTGRHTAGDKQAGSGLAGRPHVTERQAEDRHVADWKTGFGR